MAEADEELLGSGVTPGPPGRIGRQDSAAWARCRKSAALGPGGWLFRPETG